MKKYKEEKDIKEEEQKEEGKKQSKAGKAINVIFNILLGVFIVCAAFVLTISVVSKKDSDGTATIFNTQLRFVQSDSMDECDQTDVSQYKIKSIKVKSCVFVNVIPEDEEERAKWLDEIEIGDVLTFKYVYTKQETITHRVVNKVSNNNGGYIITLEGDNKSSTTGTLKQTINTSDVDSPNYIVGKVVGQSYVLGLIIYALKSTLGIVLIIIIPCSIIIIYNAIKIFRVCAGDRKEKAMAQVESQNKKIEELKKQLEMLQKNTSNKEENEDKGD